MNNSIKTVALHTNNARVREIARQLYANADKRVRITFIKKDGTERVMDCVPRNEYNKAFGIQTTKRGAKMVASKAKNDMITVSEIVGNGILQPRTINLRTVVGNIIPLG